MPSFKMGSPHRRRGEVELNGKLFLLKAAVINSGAKTCFKGDFCISVVFFFYINVKNTSILFFLVLSSPVCYEAKFSAHLAKEHIHDDCSAQPGKHFPFSCYFVD